MKKNYSISMIFVAIIAILFSSFGENAFAQREQDTVILKGSLKRTFKIAKDGIVSLRNLNGNVRVESWDKDEVEISINERRRGDYDIELEFESSSDRVEVVARHPRRRNVRQSPSADFEVRVPKGVELEASSTNGDVFVRNMESEINATTTNGEVNVVDVKGTVNAHTTNGNIEIDNVTGDLRAQTTNQSVYLRNVHSSRIDARTTNGSIKGDFFVDPDGDYELGTTNGSIDVRIPKNSKADVDVTCRARSFSSDFDISSRYDRDRRNRWSTENIDGKINGGGARIRMRTTNGRVELRAK